MIKILANENNLVIKLEIKLDPEKAAYLSKNGVYDIKWLPDKQNVNITVKSNEEVSVLILTKRIDSDKELDEEELQDKIKEMEDLGMKVLDHIDRCIETSFILSEIAKIPSDVDAKLYSPNGYVIDDIDLYHVRSMFARLPADDQNVTAVMPSAVLKYALRALLDQHNQEYERNCPN